MLRQLPYVRLSSFYFFYFASIGVFVPYWSVYLDDLGFGAQEIGELIAISLATKIIAPYIWGWIADHTGNSLGIIRWTSLAAAVSFIFMFYGQSYLWLALVVSAFSFFWHAVLPQFEATTLNYLGDNPASYGRIRLWGSVGFIVAVVGFGWLIDQGNVALLPALMLAIMVLIWLSTLLFKQSPTRPTGHTSAKIFSALKRPEVIALLVSAGLLQMSHGPYYTFFSLYLERYGYSGAWIGQLWALGVIAEIFVFLAAGRLLPRFGIVRLFQLSLLITAVRWVLLSQYADALAILLLAQVMHAASYGLFHATAIELINRYFPGRLQGRGQALYSSVSYGVGNALGSLGSGYLWDRAGAEATFLVASLVCALGMVIAWVFIKRQV